MSLNLPVLNYLCQYTCIAFKTDIPALQSDLRTDVKNITAAKTDDLKNINVLMEIMKGNVLIDNKDGRPTQFIIFVKTIELAKRLTEMLKSKAYICEFLVGTAGKALYS